MPSLRPGNVAAQDRRLQVAGLPVSNQHHWILTTHGDIVGGCGPKSASDMDRSKYLDPWVGNHTYKKAGSLRICNETQGSLRNGW